MVFVATKHHVDYLHDLLRAAGIDSTYSYGSLDQTGLPLLPVVVRGGGDSYDLFAITVFFFSFFQNYCPCAHTHALLLQKTARKINVARFRARKCMLMLVTDVAARGIDIPLLDCVINYDFPCKPSVRVHILIRTYIY